MIECLVPTIHFDWRLNSMRAKQVRLGSVQSQFERFREAIKEIRGADDIDDLGGFVIVEQLA
jgi:hypothetical protein